MSHRDSLKDLAVADRERLIRQQALVGDPRRWRPRWFDGRFLAAADLQAEQNYFLVRQADLGRAGGSGVVDGLMASEFIHPQTGVESLRIQAGAGVTDTGELIVLADDLTVEPANIPETQRLDAAFGLQILPNEPGRTRTGLYVLALRPVEWTANPLGAYPTSLTGRRTVEDGTIVEGVAVSLIPYPDTGDDESWHRRRARVAREIFVEGRDHGRDSGVLPLALVALRGNFIEWVDPFLVRRETGAERPAGMDFGFGARALREAHLLQYQRHLADALNANSERPFAAAAYFDALPPVGQLPAAALNPDTLTQRFFPAGIDVELAFLPQDELPALIEESLLLPPLDLTAGLDGLEGTGVVVLVPLSRSEFNRHRSVLPNWDARLPELRPAFTGVKVRATPRELLLGRLRPISALAVIGGGSPVREEEPWRQLLRGALSQRLLWYVRRRHLPIPANVAGTPVNADHVTVTDRSRLADLIRDDDQLSEGFDRLRDVGTPEVEALTGRLASTRLLAQPALIRSMVVRASGSGETPPSPGDAVAALAPATDPKLGEGLESIKAEDAALARTLNTKTVANTGVLADLDKLARDVPPEKFPAFTAELKTAAANRETLPARVAELRRKFVTQ